MRNAMLQNVVVLLAAVLFLGCTKRMDTDADNTIDPALLGDWVLTKYENHLRLDSSLRGTYTIEKGSSDSDEYNIISNASMLNPGTEFDDGIKYYDAYNFSYNKFTRLITLKSITNGYSGVTESVAINDPWKTAKVMQVTDKDMVLVFDPNNYSDSIYEVDYYIKNLK